MKQQHHILATHRRSTIMPEYLFFHDMSGQGILTWPEYRSILGKIPYQMKYEKYFDELSDESGQNIPSTFVWCLLPQ